ncbi:MAG TPA: PhzF family phenazine biosynthesis protein, partial [Spirochaetia bacterium]|nr:PhzF family phenazine biosynthesis protein [Spirochaetia bacterium]
MKKLPFKKIDAFATVLSDGNPAGYIRLRHPEEVSPVEMRVIATQLKGFVNEVGFAAEGPDGSLALTYYSSEREVEFCGHATIAIMYDLIAGDGELAEKEIVTIHTSQGSLPVYNRLRDEDAVYVTAPAPEYKNGEFPPRELAAALSLPEAEFDAD